MVDLNELLMSQKMAEALKQRDFEDEFRSLKGTVDSLKSENQFLNKKLTQKDEEVLSIRQEVNNRLEKLQDEKGKEETARKVNKLQEVISTTSAMKDGLKSIDCPSCHNHKLKKVSPLEIKCEGPDCDTKFFLYPKKVDYECESCGFPMSKETMVKHNIEKCPRCGSTKANPIEKRR